jgi:hypothetical protein
MDRMQAFTWTLGLVVAATAAVLALGPDQASSQTAGAAAAAGSGPATAVAAGELLIEPPTLINLKAATGQDRNSVELDYDSFVNVPRLDAQDAATVQKLYDAGDLDFRLKPESPAVDRGLPLATVTDGFAGRGPDLGALERGQPPPVYGPRPKPAK